MNSIKLPSEEICLPFQGNEPAFYQALLAEQRQAFNCLYLRVHNQFIPLACQKGGSYDEALDVLNDCLAIFLHKIRTGEFVFQADTRITSYLYRVCYNQWHNYIDKRQQRKEVSLDLNRPTSDKDDNDDDVYDDTISLLPDEQYDEQERLEWVTRLKKAISQLREDCQNMLHWFYVEELPLREIAARLGMTEDSAAVKRFKCAKYLRERYLKA
ncbi:RNA polymerase sigma factor [Nibrella viscosa]|uniref:RNA polymerase sigma factor n=1 Tax=Nibrella viscosa TaxID=1084524 RepID=UPI0031E96385